MERGPGLLAEAAASDRFSRMAGARLMSGEGSLIRILGYRTCSRCRIRRVVALLDGGHFCCDLECGGDTEVEDASRHRNIDSKLRRRLEPQSLDRIVLLLQSIPSK